MNNSGRERTIEFPKIKHPSFKHFADASNQWKLSTKSQDRQVCKEIVLIAIPAFNFSTTCNGKHDSYTRHGCTFSKSLVVDLIVALLINIVNT